MPSVTTLYPTVNGGETDLPTGSSFMRTSVYDGNADGLVDLAAGGTGASTAAGARTALGLGSAAVLDVTSQVFASRSAATAATIPSTVDFITVLHGTVASTSLISLEYISTTGSSVALTTADGRKWVPAGEIRPEHFGAVGDGVTNDAAAILSASQYAQDRIASVGGGSVLFVARYYAATTIDVGTQVTWRGEHEYRDSANRSHWATTRSCIVLNPAATIRTYSGSRLIGLVIMRSGMVFDPTVGVTSAELLNYAGTAVTAKSAALYMSGCTILGFERGIDTDTVNTPRFRLAFVNIDCTNGFRSDNDRGGHFLLCVHCHGFASAGYPALERSGVAFELKNLSDWTVMNQCFALAYHTGFLLDVINNVTLTQCGADGCKVGYRVTGDSSENCFTDCRAASNGANFTAVPGDTAAMIIETVDDRRTVVNNPMFHSLTDQAILLTGGELLMTGGYIRTVAAGAATPVGVRVNNAAAKLWINGTHINNMTHAVEIISASEWTIDPSTKFHAISGETVSGSILSFASASSPSSIPANASVMEVTGTTTINTLPTARVPIGKELFVIATNGLELSTAGNISSVSGANIVLAAGDVVRLLRVSSGYKVVGVYGSRANLPLMHSTARVAAPVLTISSDAITVTHTNHRIDTEGAAATDDLQTINGGKDGDILVLSTVSSSRDVTIITGGNIFAPGVVLNHANDRLVLERHSGNWIRLSFADNG